QRNLSDHAEAAVAFGTHDGNLRDLGGKQLFQGLIALRIFRPRWTAASTSRIGIRRRSTCLAISRASARPLSVRLRWFAQSSRDASAAAVAVAAKKQMKAKSRTATCRA